VRAPIETSATSVPTPKPRAQLVADSNSAAAAAKIEQGQGSAAEKSGSLNALAGLDSPAKTAAPASADLQPKPALDVKSATIPQGQPVVKPSIAVAAKPLTPAAGSSPKATETLTKPAASSQSEVAAEAVRPGANSEEESNQEIATVASARADTARDDLAADNIAADNEAADDEAAATAEADAPGPEEPSNVASAGNLGPDLAALTQSLDTPTDGMSGLKTDLFARPVAETSVSQSGNSFTSGALQPGLATTAADGPSAAGQPLVEQSASSEHAPTVPPALQVAVQISRNLNGQGGQSFNIQLKPERLGTVDVKLEIDDKGKATATVTADRPETLQLLRQDAHHLIRSLNEAGVAADASTLSFSLKDTSSGSFGDQTQRFGRGESGGTGASADEPMADEAQAAWSDPSRILDFHA